MHTTASDGRLTPAALVARASAAGLTTMSVTDHDTVAAVGEVTAAGVAAGIRVIPGIEITAVDRERDVHMLGYFFDPDSAGLAKLLVAQRALRVERVREIATRLAALGLAVDVESVLLSAAARPGSSIGRPQVARELVRAGLVPSVQHAFDQFLAAGRPAFVPRIGPSPASVVDAIHDAGGIASMAHPGVTNRDDLIAPLVEGGLDAIEVYHSDHTPDDVIAYWGLAVRLGALVSGGSDFHGEEPAFAKATAGRDAPPPARAQRNALGVVSLPAEAFAALEQKAASIRSGKPL